MINDHEGRNAVDYFIQMVVREGNAERTTLVPLTDLKTLTEAAEKKEKEAAEAAKKAEAGKK